MTCLAVLGLCNRCKLLVNNEQVAVAHTNCKKAPNLGVIISGGSRIRVGSCIGATFELCVPRLPSRGNIPNSEYAITAYCEEFGLLWMGCESPKLLIRVRLEEHLGFLTFWCAELNDFTTSGSNEELACLWVLSHALDLWVHRFHISSTQIVLALLDEASTGVDCPDDRLAVLTTSYQAFACSPG